MNDKTLSCPKCERVGKDCGEHTPSWGELACYWKDKAEAQATRIEALEADNAKLRGALASMANSINIVGSPYHRAQEALDAIVMETKRSARKALEGSGNG